MNMDLRTLSDDQLFKLCNEYGKRAREWKRKFAGLLPEVYKRNLFRKTGFSSIYHFAAVLAGISQEQVNTILRLDKKFSATPKLRNLLITGEVSHHKLIRIASVVNNENQNFWSEQVKSLPVSSLNTLVKDAKGKRKTNEKLSIDSNCSKIHFNQLTEQRLKELQQKGFDLNELINPLLDQREEQLAHKKSALIEKYKNKTSPRHIPKEIQDLISQEYGNACAVPNCSKPKYETHHLLPFALAQNHNPLFLVPLCKAHHQIAHSVDTKVTQMRIQNS